MSSGIETSRGIPFEQVGAIEPPQPNTEHRPAVDRLPTFMWFEITGRCQLACDHCYADSGPSGTHGTMTPDDWERVIGQGAELGVEHVQFIGGEPTLHPALPRLIGRALREKIKVEVYSNLSHVRPPVWDALSQDNVSLATSYYSNDPSEHANITKGPGSHKRTRDNIAEAVQRGIPLRVGVIAVNAGQHVEEGIQDLINLGVEPGRIQVDHLRQVGRGVRESAPSVAELCGKCSLDLAIGPDGQVWPCVFSRWLPVGNVREQSLGEVLTSEKLRATRCGLNMEFDKRLLQPSADCPPSQCAPYCRPSEGTCTPDCPPRYNPCMPDLPQPCNPQNCGPAN